MPDCCSTSPDACREGAPATAKPMTSCPECRKKGKAVELRTPEHLLTGEARTRLTAGEYCFCPAPDCPVVYFSADGASVFRKEDMRVRVTQKENADPVPVCYCYGFFRADLVREIQETGTTTVPDQIKAGVKAGTCDCEEKNPQGSCCLGNVTAAVKWAEHQPVTTGKPGGVS